MPPKGTQRVLTILTEDGSSVEVVQDGAILLKRTLHLFPRHELPNLPRQLHKFLRHKDQTEFSLYTKWQAFRKATRGGERRLANLEVDMAIGQPVGTSFIQKVNVFDQQAEERNHNLERQNKEEICRWK